MILSRQKEKLFDVVSRSTILHVQINPRGFAIFTANVLRHLINAMKAVETGNHGLKVMKISNEI